MRYSIAVLSSMLLLSIGGPVRAETTYEFLVSQLKSTMTAACNLYPDCERRVGSFVWFLWNNRDKSDIQFNTVKCIGYSAVARGYIWEPMKVLDDLTPVTAQELAIEVCDCVVGSWGKEMVCPIPKDMAQKMGIP